MVTDVRKVGIAFVAIKRLVVVRKRGVEDIEHAVVLKVADGDAHRCGLAPSLVKRIARSVAHVFKSPVAFIQIEIVRCGIVPDEQVWLAVIVDVDKNRAEAVVARLVGHTGFVAYVGKCAIAVVVEEVVRFALQTARTASCRLTAKGAKGVAGAAFAALRRRIAPVPVQVPGDKKIEVVHRRRSRPM